MIKSSPLYVLPIVTANLINIAAKPNDYSITSLWMNIIVIVVVIVQNIPTHTLHISYLSKSFRFVEAGLREHARTQAAATADVRSWGTGGRQAAGEGAS